MVRSNVINKYEQILKGAANKHRLRLMYLIQKHPDLSSEDISEKIKMNYQTCSDHLRKLVRTGLVGTYREGNRMNHVLTQLGENTLSFLESLDE